MERIKNSERFRVWVQESAKVFEQTIVELEEKLGRTFSLEERDTYEAHWIDLHAVRLATAFETEKESLCSFTEEFYEIMEKTRDEYREKIQNLPVPNNLK